MNGVSALMYSRTEKTIMTERLFLRLFHESDAEEVTNLCNNYRIYKSTLNLPFPYTLECAMTWISNHKDNFESDKLYEFAITDKVSGQLLGAIALSNRKQNKHGEIAYWIGEQYWGNGYATEAAKAVIDFAFQAKDYHRVYACHFKSNPASGTVMKKCGLEYEGTLKEHIYKEGAFEDLVYYGLVRTVQP